MSLRGKIRMYKTCMTSVMSCAIETRAETTITKGLLRTIRTLKCITGSELVNRIHNICQIQDITRWDQDQETSV